VNLSPKTTAILLGTAIGATIGAGAAWTYMRQREASYADAIATAGLPPKMNANAGEFIRIGIALFALLRQFDDLFKP
jgi:hypothetical protein